MLIYLAYRAMAGAGADVIVESQVMLLGDCLGAGLGWAGCVGCGVIS